jgi:hypothetical protein
MNAFTQTMVALDIIDKIFLLQKKREKDGPSSAFFKI